MTMNLIILGSFHLNQRRNDYFQAGCGAHSFWFVLSVAKNGSWTDLDTILQALEADPLTYIMGISGDVRVDFFLKSIDSFLGSCR